MLEESTNTTDVNDEVYQWQPEQYEVSPGEFDYPRRILYNKENGDIIYVIERQQGAWKPGLRPIEMGYIDTFDPRPVKAVNVETDELTFEDVPEANIKDVAAQLTQQGITPEMLPQIQQTMLHQTEATP